MNRKTTILLILLIMAVFSLVTCDEGLGLFDRPMKLILPSALYANDTTLNKGNGIVTIYDYEDSELIVELEVLDGGEEYLSVPGFVKIPENELSVTFTCEAVSAESGAGTEVTVTATALHYKDDVEDTVTIYE